MTTVTFCNLGSSDYPLSHSTTQTGIINIEHLGVQYRLVEALRDVTCPVEPGRLTGIIGPNGAGKSTLMKAMLGLVSPTSGTAVYQGKPLMEQLDRVAYVPQRSQIDWTYPATVWDVVLMGRVRKTGWFRRFSTVSRRVAADALERVGMSEYRNRPIGQLSGGQQQRVFLAKALTEEAEIFCFDEPMAGIDKKTEAVVFGILHELADAGKMVLVVHHDLGEAVTNFDDLILLNRELIARGSRQEVLTGDNLQRAYGGQVVFFSEAA
ncbi:MULTISPECIES: metal ABC transporter ATP-binding protein [unclassified Coleofasciculus]|uniref:metal ABC transporter ATP-binding protein n=1 Tax=unclassified Coleofasciculus TaxID=2692782 RepID=UPI001882B2B0|nr:MULTISPECIES: metal ABC transporter ATP-binding protein [unclassified Coleofasciculus]MBE9125514.1 metal ABC transporter ATP-binding protein [Coleofasciculus sp. LEGE 07081]MBE9148622.1 metal ABC transporter ATP-binding protein [Coleofasciculus sp. LEGE 07092]